MFILITNLKSEEGFRITLQILQSELLLFGARLTGMERSSNLNKDALTNVRKEKQSNPSLLLHRMIT